MDYIGLWFIKGARYIQNTLAELCFVSTNSACQGEHVGIIFPKIFRANVEIGFAYTSFKWTNNAKDQAGVSVIIVSLRNRSNKQKYLYTGDITEAVYNISPYLVPGDDLIIYRRPKPFSSDFPEMNFGSMPRSKALVLTTEEKNLIISHDPNARKFIRRYVGAEDYLNGKERFCIWVPESDYSEADKIQELHNRFEIVREERLKSRAASTKKLADKPYRFVQISYKDTQSIIVPGHTSERRTYIPMGILSEEEIISNAAFAIYDAELWLFSILQSRSHMAWIKSVCGYLGTGIRYAKQLGYNTFPIPLLNLKQKEQLSNSAMDILMAREKHTEMTLAQMYDPDKMPEDLRNTHDVNDLLVDKLYQDKAFLNDEERLVKLLSMYEELTKDKK